MPVEVVGRDDELAGLTAFLGRSADAARPGALVLEGAAGIGKSTLWAVGVDAARERGLRVLSARPAESERGLAYAGLGDLLGGSLDDVLPALTPPRRRALEVALLVHDAGGAPVDARALGVAVESALELLAEDGPFLLAVDDVQWLDASSASALGFALRRLDAQPVLALLARRTEEGVGPSVVEEAVESWNVERVHVGPLSIGATHGLLQARLGRAFPRPTLVRVHEAAGGNPFYALELARPLRAGDALADPTKPLPVPERLEQLVAARLDGFDDATRSALALASAQANLTTAQLSAAGLDERALEPALDERVVELTSGRIRFAHPLLASVLYGSLPAAERRRTHRLLAEVTDDPVGRARHLALSAARPDARISAALERAADAAKAQGAPIVAAELGEHALRLTPAGADGDRRRRATAAARAHIAAGELERARALAAELGERAEPGPLRAEALVLLADVEWDTLPAVIPVLREALVEAKSDPALQASIHQRLALTTRFTEGLVVAEAHAQAGVELAERLGDDALLSDALAGLAITRFNLARDDAPEHAERAFALAGDEPTNRMEASFALVHVLVWSRRLERARALLEDLVQVWSERDERLAANALWYLSLTEFHAGRLALADDLATRARELSVQYAPEADEAPQNVFPLMLIAAARGRVDRARELAELGAQFAVNLGSRLGGNFRAMTATLDAWAGDTQRAVEIFAEAEQLAASAVWREPAMLGWRDDYVQSLVELERIDEAVALLDPWEADAQRLGRAWVLAHATRCRGLIAAARGEVDEAIALLERAADGSGAAGDPFGRARSLLALGTLRRRAKQKRAARETLESALAAFDEIGAEGWAEAARAELGRIGGRSAIDGLTPAERRVADLVAEGRTNREVAAALFLGERTIASHLTHIYAKLGVRSRTELARRLQ